MNLSNIQAFKNLSDVDFVDKGIEQILADMIEEYEEAYFESTGKRKTLAPGDPVRIWLYSQALRIYGAYQLIDFSAKQNLLKYSEGYYLENVGARVGVTRLPASFAVCVQRFTLSSVQTSAVAIQQGTRVSPGNDLYFSTIVSAEIPAGATYVDVTCQCTTEGIVGNGYVAGQINILVDPIPFIESVENTTESQGGANLESDDVLSERIFLKPESFSVAGPKGAYTYFTQEYSSAIGDVSVTSSLPGVVDVRFILKNGDLPDTPLIQGVSDYLSDDTRRPLTDLVKVSAPAQVSYDINITYYIGKSNSFNVANIQTAVDKAVSDFKLWQKTKIGRDINPSELNAMVRNAGAKRVVVTSPIFVDLNESEVAIDNITTVTYGGLEDE